MTHSNLTSSKEPTEAPAPPDHAEDRRLEERRLLRPWKGLFLAALVFIAPQGLSGIRSLVWSPAPHTPPPTCDCAYTLSIDGKIMGTTLFDGPRRLREIAAQIGLEIPHEDANALEAPISCDRIIALSRTCTEPASLPLSGKALMVLGVPMDLNAASPKDLEALSGIGPKLAQLIVDYRETHGNFASVDELTLIPGIGRVKSEVLAKSVAVKPHKHGLKKERPVRTDWSGIIE